MDDFPLPSLDTGRCDQPTVTNIKSWGQAPILQTTFPWSRLKSGRRRLTSSLFREKKPSFMVNSKKSGRKSRRNTGMSMDFLWISYGNPRPEILWKSPCRTARRWPLWRRLHKPPGASSRHGPHGDFWTVKSRNEEKWHEMDSKVTIPSGND